jgi:hypothetical protein
MNLPRIFKQRHIETEIIPEASDIIDELGYAQDSLLNALSYGSVGRGILDRSDKRELLDMIDQLRRFAHYIERRYH